MKSKHCRKCDSDKPVSEFFKRKDAKDGLQFHCKQCQTHSRKLRERKGGSSYTAKVVRESNRRSKEQLVGSPIAMKRLVTMRDEITEITGVSHHLGHIHPLTNDLVCGLHTAKNIVIEPATVNLQHSNHFCCYRVDFTEGVRYYELEGEQWVKQHRPSWHPIASVNNLI